MISRSKLIRNIVFMINLLTVKTVFASAPYCLAIRGNGELEPAHWGALASVVEKMGLPQAQAGGSSGSITAFILDSVASNPWVSSGSEAEKKIRAAWLLKSLHGVSNYLWQQPSIQNALDLKQTISRIQKSINNGDLSTLLLIAQSENVSTLQKHSADISLLVKTLNNIGIGDSVKYKNFLQDLKDISTGHLFSIARFKRAQFYSQDLHQAISMFGSFDAQTDANLFFREGIINFKKLGDSLGKVATFVAGQDWNAQTTDAFNKLNEQCLPMQDKITWEELTKKEPKCQTLLNTTLRSFFSQKHDWNTVNVSRRQVGYAIPSFPTTSVLTGQAYQLAQQAYTKYHQNLDHQAAIDFKILNPNEVRFGYWGRPADLASIQKNLNQPFTNHDGRTYDFRNDFKSKKFLSLGSAAWQTILGLSPAEPGLASLQIMTANGNLAFSAGGWSDLHPILILKAAGCDNVIYITRTGGDSLFAQGIAKRLLNLDRSWDLLSTSAEFKTKNNALNNSGDANDLSSAWSQIFNVANANSSYMYSVSMADAVVCTDWNKFDITKDFQNMINEAYTSPMAFPNNSPLRSELISNGAVVLSDFKPGCQVSGANK